MDGCRSACEQKSRFGKNAFRTRTDRLIYHKVLLNTKLKQS